jgi:hypothetical protein
VTNGTSVAKKEVKGTYVSIHSSGFRDFLLKPEILRAIADCGFEHPSEGKKDFCVKVLGLTFHLFSMNLLDFSTTRVHSSSCSWHGYLMPSQIWYGEDRRVCPCNTAAA